MNTQKPDPELDALLRGYDVPDMAPASREALLDRIVGFASASPHPPPFRFPFAGRRLSAWVPDATALAALALFGFWIGTGTIGSSILQTAAERQTASIDEAYYNEIVFGPTSWKEVSL